MKRQTLFLMLAAAMAAGLLGPGAPASANPMLDQAPALPAGPPEPPMPQIPAPPQAPGIPAVDQQRALRELALARARLPEAAGFARTVEDGRALLAIARKALERAEQEYAAGRYYQAAETAAAAVKLTEAIRHLYWAQAR